MHQTYFYISITCFDKEITITLQKSLTLLNAELDHCTFPPELRESTVSSVQVGGEGGDAALGDLRVLVLVLADAVEVLDVAGPAQQLHKVLVVGDDQQLEVPLARAALYDPGEGDTARQIQTDHTTLSTTAKFTTLLLLLHQLHGIEVATVMERLF